MSSEQFQRRIDAAARSLRPRVPDDLWADIQRQLPATPERPPAPLLRPWRRALAGGLSAAAALLLAALLFLDAFVAGPPAIAPIASSDWLVGDAVLAASESLDRQREAEATTLHPGESPFSPLADEMGSALREELAFVEDALTECRTALDHNQRHAHLRHQLEELGARRLNLLAQLERGP